MYLKLELSPEQKKSNKQKKKYQTDALHLQYKTS